MLLAIFFNNIFIGYGGMVHINWQNQVAEVSFLISPQISEDSRKYSEIFRKYLGLISTLASFIGIKKLYTETFEFRKSHILALEGMENGFKRIKLGEEIENKQKEGSVFHEKYISEKK
jgi:hypothetical protein